MRKDLNRIRFGFLDVPIDHIHWINPLKTMPDFARNEKEYWIIPFDEKDVYVVIEYNTKTDGYKLVYCNKEEKEIYTSMFRECVEIKYEEVFNKTSISPIMSWMEFHQFFEIILNTKECYELKPVTKDNKFLSFLIREGKNISFEIREKETDKTIEELKPVYIDEDRIYEIQDLFNIYSKEVIKKDKEEIFKKYIEDESLNSK